MSKFDETNLHEAVEAGTWQKISQSQVLKHLMVSIDKAHKADNLQRLLIVHLNTSIVVRDRLAVDFETDMAQSAERQKANLPVVSKLEQDIINICESAKIEIVMLNNLLADTSEQHKELFKKEITLPVADDTQEPVWHTVNLGFCDGARTEFKLEAVDPADKQVDLNEYVFDIQFQSL